MKQKKGISAFDFFTIGFGAIVGVGWAVIVNNWMSSAGGALPAALGFLITLLVILPVAMCYAELCPMLPVAGASVAFSYRAFGEKIAFVSGWAALMAFAAVLPWEAIYINDILAMIIPGVHGGPILYHVMGTPVYLRSMLIGEACAVLIFLMNWFGARTSAKFQKTLCIVLLASIGLTLACCLFKFDFENLTPVYENVGVGNHSSFYGGAIAMFAIAPFFIFGFETIPQGIEDAAGSVKSVGKVIFLSLIAAGVTYAAILFVVGGAYPWQESAGLPTPAAGNLLRILYPGAFGNALYIFILLGVLCGLMTTWNAFFIATSRLMLGLGRASLLPAKFSEIHEKRGTPWFALICCGIISAIGPFLGPSIIGILTSITSVALMVCWFNDTRALIVLRRKEPDLNRPYRLAGGKLIAAIGMCVCVILFVMCTLPASPAYVGNIGIFVIIGWGILGIIFFLGNRRKRNAIPYREKYNSVFEKMPDR
ncbi:MAG: APC family permease [Bacillota bacterium]|nr:APC family permease [Bacillota bacterium]